MVMTKTSEIREKYYPSGNIVIRQIYIPKQLSGLDIFTHGNEKSTIY